MAACKSSHTTYLYQNKNYCKSSLPITRTSKVVLPYFVSTSNVSALTNSCRSQTQGQQHTWELPDTVWLGSDADLKGMLVHKFLFDGLTGEPDTGQNPPKSSLISLAEKVVDLK